MAKDNNRTSKITLWLSFGVLGAAIIAAVFIFLLPTGESNDAQDVAPTASPAPASSPPEDADAIGCNAPASDNREVPDDLRWASVNGVTWPVSDSTGPTTTTDGFPACFEHSPRGAALAAVSVIFSQMEHTPFDSAEFYLAESPGRDATLDDAAPGAASQLKETIESNGISVVGFQVEEYDGDRAAMRVVLRVPSSATGFRGLPYPMVWVDGDWKVKPLDTGSTGQASDVRDGEFTYWTAVGNG